MSDIREEFEKWVNANQGYTYWDVWQAAHARYGTTDRSRWRLEYRPERQWRYIHHRRGQRQQAASERCQRKPVVHAR